MAYVLTLFCDVFVCVDEYFKRRLLLSKRPSYHVFVFYSCCFSFYNTTTHTVTHKVDSMKNEVANIRISIMTLIICYCKELWLNVFRKNPIYFFYESNFDHHSDQAAHFKLLYKIYTRTVLLVLQNYDRFIILCI